MKNKKTEPSRSHSAVQASYLNYVVVLEAVVQVVQRSVKSNILGALIVRGSTSDWTELLFESSACARDRMVGPLVDRLLGVLGVLGLLARRQPNGTTQADPTDPGPIEDALSTASKELHKYAVHQQLGDRQKEARIGQGFFANQSQAHHVMLVTDNNARRPTPTTTPLHCTALTQCTAHYTTNHTTHNTSHLRTNYHTTTPPARPTHPPSPPSQPKPSSPTSHTTHTNSTKEKQNTNNHQQPHNDTDTHSIADIHTY